MGRLEQRVAIVTGAGAGIGKAIARRYAAEGAAVLLAEYNAATGMAVAEEIRREFGARAEFLQVDVCDKTQVVSAVDEAVKRFGKVDILVNNAWGRLPGSTGMGPLEGKTDEELEHAFRVGCMAAFWAMQAAFPYMREQRWGRIISLASLNGVNAHMYTVDYNAAKEALRALTRTAAREWGKHQICCNIICPGAASEAYKAFAAANPDNAAAINKMNPMGRIGDPEQDIAGVAVFLASEDARYLTGNTLFVDGGAHINGVNWVPEGA